MANTITLKGTFANKGNTVTSSYTDTPVTLMAVYVDDANNYIYAVDSKQVIRKMSITRDVTHARKQFKVAKSLVGKQVFFGVTSGWNSEVWFNEITKASS